MIFFCIFAYCVALALLLVFIKGAKTIDGDEDQYVAPEPTRGPSSSSPSSSSPFMRPTVAQPELSI